MSAAVWVALPMAVSRGPDHALIPQPSSVGDRIRGMVNRMSRNVDPEVREVLGHVGDALSDLEGRVNRMQHRVALAESGLEIRTELVRIAESGLELQHSLPCADGEEVVVYLDLTVWGSSRLLSLPGRVVRRAPEASIHFVGLPQDKRDTLVAFVFQEQGREIRHAQAKERRDP